MCNNELGSQFNEMLEVHLNRKKSYHAPLVRSFANVHYQSGGCF